MSQVFLSYSRADADTVLQIRNSLTRRGIDVWIDQEDIGTGSRWDIQIEKGIQECRIILVILSPASVASQNVGDEWSYALDKEKHIIPVMLEECEVPMRIASLQRIEFFDDFEKGMKSLAQAILDDSAIANSVKHVRPPFDWAKFFSVLKPITAIALTALLLGAGYYRYQQWSEVAIPSDLVGKSESDVIAQLKELHIGVERVVVEQSDNPANTVIRMEPQPNTLVKRFSSVVLTVAADKVIVPNLVGHTIEEAKRILESSEFNVEIAYKFKQGASPGEVHEVSPSEGESVKKQTLLRLFVAPKALEGWVEIGKGDEGDVEYLARGQNLRSTPRNNRGENLISVLAKGTPVLVQSNDGTEWRKVWVLDQKEVGHLLKCFHNNLYCFRS